MFEHYIDRDSDVPITKRVYDILTEKQRLEFFPDPKNVFKKNAKQYSTHILPLFSLDLSLFMPPWESSKNSQWKGKIHFIAPIGTYEGYLGDYTPHEHTYYVRHNWIGFKHVNNRYEFLADLKYFILENDEKDKKTIKELKKIDGTLNETQSKLSRIYDNVHTCYQNAKDNYFKQFSDKKVSKKYITDRIPLLGGIPYEGNWSYSGFPINELKIPCNGSVKPVTLPFTENKKMFYFIAGVDCNAFFKNKFECQVFPYRTLMFYEPNEKIALFSFDWT
jgi:hypothetical protein